MKIWIVLLWSCMLMIRLLRNQQGSKYFKYERKIPLFRFESRYKCLGRELWMVNVHDVPIKRIWYYTGSKTLHNILVYQQQLYWSKTRKGNNKVNIDEKKREREKNGRGTK